MAKHQVVLADALAKVVVAETQTATEVKKLKKRDWFEWSTWAMVFVSLVLSAVALART